MNLKKIDITKIIHYFNYYINYEKFVKKKPSEMSQKD